MQKAIKGLVLLLAVALVGCMAWFLQQDGQAAVQEGTTRHVTDSTGTEVDIPAHPQRVVFLNVSNMDLFVAAGGADKIAGRPTSHSMSEALADAVKEVPEVGIIHTPNVEKILALQPDLVIGVNVSYHNKMRDTLAQNGIPLYINALDTLEDTYHTLAFFGELTGEETVAAGQADSIRYTCDAAIDKAKGKTGPQVLLLFSTPDSASAATSKSFPGDLLKRIGAVNIADLEAEPSEAFVPLSKEYVLRHNPDVIGIISMGQAEGQAEQFLHQMHEDESWRETRAVQQGRVFLLPSSLFTVNPGSRVGQALEYLANHVYGGAS